MYKKRMQTTKLFEMSKRDSLKRQLEDHKKKVHLAPSKLLNTKLPCLSHAENGAGLLCLVDCAKFNFKYTFSTYFCS